MKKLLGIAAIFFAFNTLSAHAEDSDDWRTRHADARNDRQLSELSDKHPPLQAKAHHVARRTADITHRVTHHVAHTAQHVAHRTADITHRVVNDVKSKFE
ncbi:MAG TPA: hypothetical protein VIE65_03500 [Methylobacter sp.]